MLRSVSRLPRPLALRQRLAGLVLGAALLIANVSVLVWAADRQSSAEDAPAGVDVALVLGARVHEGGRISDALVDRLATALDLYRTGRVHRILLSGDGSTSSNDETAAMLRWTLAHGVPRADVIVDAAGYRTLDSMFRARSVYGLTRVLVCTQDFHLARALLLAHAAGIDAWGISADRRVYQRRFLHAVRESLARPAALLDLYVLHRGPRVLGRVPEPVI